MKSKIPPVNNYASFVVLNKAQGTKTKESLVKIIAREISNHISR